jgi:hypothetical protein
MSVERQSNWLGQQRVDVPHLRTLDSSNANDFDVLAGVAIAGKNPLVVTGFVLATTGAIGQPATSLQLQVDPGVILHYNASENGTIFRTQPGTAPQVLSSTNPQVLGSFTASQLNYVGLDLRRATDPTTSDLVEFLDANTLLENPETVPLARTLNFVIVISTSDFTSSPNVLPIALVTTDANNNVLTIQDARNLLGRLGTGGTTPNPFNAYSWPQGRNELATGENPFQGGDKAFTCVYDTIQGIESRVREIGGGPFWYSATADRQVKFGRNLNARFPNGDNFTLYPNTTSPTDLLWQGLVFVFCNSGIAGTYENAIADQATPLPGLTDLAPGECIYVDIDELEQIPLANPSGVTALQPQKGTMATLGVPSPPFTRWVIAWCIAGTNGSPDNYYTLDSQWSVGSILAPAGPYTSGGNGVVELNIASPSPANPVVTIFDTITLATVTPAISRGATGTAGAADFGAGVLAIGPGLSDTTIAIGNSSGTLTTQLIRLGYGQTGLSHTTDIDGNIIGIGTNSTAAAISFSGATLTSVMTGATSISSPTGNISIGTTGTGSLFLGNPSSLTTVTALSGGVVQIVGNTTFLTATTTTNISSGTTLSVTSGTALVLTGGTTASLDAASDVIIGSTTATVISIGNFSSTSIVTGSAVNLISGASSVELTNTSVAIASTAASSSITIAGNSSTGTVAITGATVSIGATNTSDIIIGAGLTPTTLTINGALLGIGNVSTGNNGIVNIGANSGTGNGGPIGIGIVAGTGNGSTVTIGSVTTGTGWNVNIGTGGSSANTIALGNANSLIELGGSAPGGVTSGVVVTDNVSAIDGIATAGSYGVNSTLAQTLNFPLPITGGGGTGMASANVIINAFSSAPTREGLYRVDVVVEATNVTGGIGSAQAQVNFWAPNIGAIILTPLQNMTQIGPAGVNQIYTFSVVVHAIAGGVGKEMNVSVNFTGLYATYNLWATATITAI